MAFSVNVGTSNSLCDSHTQFDKQHRQLTFRRAQHKKDLLTNFEKEISSALQSSDKTVLFPMDLDPLSISASTLIKFAAVRNENQLHIEFFSDFQRMVFVFRSYGPLNEVDDLILMDIPNTHSFWEHVSHEIRLRVLKNSILMSTDVPKALVNTKNKKFVQETKKIFKSEMQMKQRHTQHKEVRNTVNHANGSTVTIQKEIFTETQMKHLKFIIIKRKTRYQELSLDWFKENNHLKMLRSKKRAWCKKLFKMSNPPYGNENTRKMLKKMADLKQTLSELDFSLVSLQYERQEVKMCEICENAYDFFHEELPEFPPQDLNSKEAIELAKTVLIPQKTCANLPFENFAEILNISRIKNYTIFHEKELIQKQLHLQKEVFEYGSFLRRKIRELQNKLNLLKEEPWIATKRKIEEHHQKKVKKIKC